MTKTEQKVKFMKDGYSKGEFTKEVLKGLAIGGIIVASFALPNLPQVLTFFKPRNYRERYKIKRTLQNLKRQKLINIYEKRGKTVIKITKKGKERELKYQIDEIKINKPEKWDGYWRVVAFDIPEKYRGGRNALAGKLKEMGLYPLQKSVFIYPFECKNEIDFIGEFFNIRRFINYLVAQEVEEMERLKKYYNL